MLLVLNTLKGIIILTAINLHVGVLPVGCRPQPLVIYKSMRENNEIRYAQ